MGVLDTVIDDADANAASGVIVPNAGNIDIDPGQATALAGVEQMPLIVEQFIGRGRRKSDGWRRRRRFGIEPREGDGFVQRRGCRDNHLVAERIIKFGDTSSVGVFIDPRPLGVRSIGARRAFPDRCIKLEAVIVVAILERRRGLFAVSV